MSSLGVAVAVLYAKEDSPEDWITPQVNALRDLLWKKDDTKHGLW